MATIGLSADECEQILEEFRLRRLDFPDQFLRELAFNYGLDAPCDIDPIDVIEIVSKPGQFEIVTCEATSAEDAEECLTALLVKAESKGIKLGYIAGALLVVKQTNLRFKLFASMQGTLMDTLHPSAQLLQAMYCDNNLSGGLRLQLILTGINTLPEFVGPREFRHPI